MSAVNPPRRTALRIVPTLLVAALAALILVVPVAVAASPHLLGGPITDDVGALTGSTDELQARLDDLQGATGTQLWVWFTDTLDGADSSDFATSTADASDLGSTDLLLVVALDDRAYGWWKGETVPLEDSELDEILSSSLEPGLRSGDEPGAIVATADGLEKAMSGSGEPVPPEDEPPPFETIPPFVVPTQPAARRAGSAIHR